MPNKQDLSDSGSFPPFSFSSTEHCNCWGKLPTIVFWGGFEKRKFQFCTLWWSVSSWSPGKWFFQALFLLGGGEGGLGKTSKTKPTCYKVFSCIKQRGGFLTAASKHSQSDFTGFTAKQYFIISIISKLRPMIFPRYRAHIWVQDETLSHFARGCLKKERKTPLCQHSQDVSSPDGSAIIN